jgi:hypothetical protein
MATPLNTLVIGTYTSVLVHEYLAVQNRHLHEWATLKDAVTNLHNIYPDLASAIPYYLALDHAILEGMLECRV